MVRTLKNSEHYTWGKNCGGWHLLKTNQLSVIQETMAKYTSESCHYHVQSQQLFYILSGEATFEINGKIIIVRASESIHVPDNTKHRIINYSNEELHFLVISQPKAHGDRVNV